ncbi:alpha-glucan family phosphorylase [Hoyosella altamirensis]|uniref:glycogen phosphorylase n=1 Tax=Hoyosella altamirensis TaxID=616997 RepID=A0A839RR68_9ACTN|nr:alpha-glucan family phosphorylase [Hoyosella altamirensis]MBB3038857.1 starch phosphorylase [Hoyosella altamirensis]
MPTRLPETLEPLRELAQNLRWSWHPDTRAVFELADAALWEQTGHNPLLFLSQLTTARKAALSTNRRFLARMRAARKDLQAYLARPAAENAPAVAYFSPEFGITESLPLYSGGLGILAGDHLKTASDMRLPLVGVGLLYRSGYFTQSFTPDGWQCEQYPTLVPEDAGFSELTSAHIHLALPGGADLYARVWVAQVGRVPLLLLDSDDDRNEEAERNLTSQLYGGDTLTRLRQELLLGIGGVRAVRAYCDANGLAEPAVYHTNEGHAGFLGLERIAELTDDGLGFSEALAAVRAGTVFTTHTPVPAGIDRFDRGLVGGHLAVALPKLPTEACLDLGAEDDPGVFNMAHMGLRLAQRCNGVSKLHGALSRSMFAPLWPGLEAEEVPIRHVTNGVHGPSWAPHAPDLGLPDEEVMSARKALREKLIEAVRSRMRSAQADSEFAAETAWVEDCLDPDVLTIGFARRVPTYKRLTLMLSDPARLRQLLLDPDRPVQLIVAGKAHPADDGGKRLIQEFIHFASDPALRRRVVFVPDYDMALGREMVGGCDVWLNTPTRPLEACGTSGMKSALNGGLNLSIGDGWWAECFAPDYGWSIPSGHDGVGGLSRDEQEAAALYDLLETKVVPLFYDDHPQWLRKIRAVLGTLRPQVLSDRMLTDYLSSLYRPAAQSAAEISASNFSPARELAEWTGRIRDEWPSVTPGALEISVDPETGCASFRAEVDCGGITPDDIEVELFVGTMQGDTLVDPIFTPMISGGGAPSEGTFEAVVDVPRGGHFGYTARVIPKHPHLAPHELGLVHEFQPSEHTSQRPLKE